MKRWLYWILAICLVAWAIPALAIIDGSQIGRTWQVLGGLGLKIVGTGTTELKSDGSIAGSGSLLMEGNAVLQSGLRLSSGGFNSCGMLTTDSSGIFVCSSAVVDTNTRYRADQGLTLTGTGFKLSSSISGSLLEFQTVSGSIVHANAELRSSGSLVTEGAATFNHSSFRLLAGGFANCTALETASGVLTCGSDADTTYTAAQGLGLSGTAFRLNATITGSLVRFATVSGSTLFAGTDSRSSGSLVVKKRAGTSTGTIMVIDSKGIVFDATNKRVGFGTSSPGQDVEISGPGSSTILRFRNQPDNKVWDWGYDASNDYFYVDEFGANRQFVIQNGGNVTIGNVGTVTFPARLFVRQTSLGTAAFRTTSDATNDDPNFDAIQQRAATTDATVTTLQSITISSSNTYLIEARVVARRTGGSSGAAEDGAAYVIRAAVKNVGGTATIIGAVNADATFEDQAGWDATIDVTGSTARIRVTGASNNNVTWHTTTFVQNLSS